jgi:WD40 repeat protein
MLPRPRLLLLACLTLLPGQLIRGWAPAAPGQAAPSEKAVRTDLYGDPLPEGAIARLGTVRLRHRQNIAAVAFSPDGKLLASCGWDEAVRLWDSMTGKLVRELINPRREGAGGIAFSPDGTKLASVGEAGTVRVWDLQTGKTLSTRAGVRERLRGVAFAPDGRTFASAGTEGSLTLWSTEDGAQPRQLLAGNPRFAHGTT